MEFNTLGCLQLVCECYNRYNTARILFVATVNYLDIICFRKRDFFDNQYLIITCRIYESMLLLDGILLTRTALA